MYLGYSSENLNEELSERYGDLDLLSPIHVPHTV